MGQGTVALPCGRPVGVRAGGHLSSLLAVGRCRGWRSADLAGETGLARATVGAHGSPSGRQRDIGPRQFDMAAVEAFRGGRSQTQRLEGGLQRANSPLGNTTSAAGPQGGGADAAPPHRRVGSSALRWFVRPRRVRTADGSDRSERPRIRPGAVGDRVSSPPADRPDESLDIDAKAHERWRRWWSGHHVRSLLTPAVVRGPAPSVDMETLLCGHSPPTPPRSA